jgi:hypothetical protein
MRRLSLVLLSAWSAGVLLACGGATAQAPEPDPAASVEALPPAPTVVSDGTTALSEPVQGGGPVGEWVPEKIEGVLAEGGEVVDGFLQQRYALTGLSAGVHVLTMTSAEFDARLVVQLPDGRELQNDDGGDGTTNSRIRFMLDAPGDVTVTATSYAPAVTGAFQLLRTVRTPGESGPTLEPGGQFMGNLDAAGLTDRLWMQFERGETVRLRLTSPDLDPTLQVEGPTGIQWYNDDAGDTGPNETEQTTDSTLEFLAPDTGWYEVTVTSYSGDAEGNYALASTVRPPVRLAEGELAPSVPYAGTEGGGRILGVFVGITAYGEPLFGCADDATYLLDAFGVRGLIHPDDAILLTDKEATVPAVARALEAMAERVGPDDVFVFFYSGHGGVVTDETPEGDVELDGTDETLALLGGEMLDDEFAAYLNEIEANTAIVALDSCQSGGFARDVIDRPGRIGLFSSDEDVLSDTAESVGAGGYLSYALREAVRGMADAKPNDGMLTAGELTDWLVESFAENHRLMNPAGALDPLQRVVMERGSLGWTDRLWVFPLGVDGEAIDASGVEWWTGPAAEGDTGVIADVQSAEAEQGEGSGEAGVQDADCAPVSDDPENVPTGVVGGMCQ